MASAEFMDLAKAQRLTDQLVGVSLKEWTVRSFIWHGKSAAVFLADGPTGEVAIKIFDSEIIELYGDETQIARIKREQELVGKWHPNLVKILGGGFDNITRNYYVVMEYLPGKNLKQCLQDIPADKIPTLIAQLASAAKFLEGEGYVHRDIKPENIVILDNFSKAVLLDLGVIRPFAGSDLTDNRGIQAFVGTLQYSSPEFLLRQEETSIEGYRALTFYQLGGVLHDLIMRKQLFSESAQPYGRLVNAVQHEIPEIQNSAIPYYLVELARGCLLKPWRTRLRLIEWDSFNPPAADESTGHSLKQRVTNRAVISRAHAEPGISPHDPHLAETLKREAIAFLTASARTIRSENSALPPLRIIPNTPNELSFGIEFRASNDCDLKADLTLFVGLEIIDCAARVIGITGCACFGAMAGCTSDPAPAQIFQGTYDGQAMYTALENCLYDLFDQAQERSLSLQKDSPSNWLQPRRVS